MKILHFVDKFSLPTETFIRRYVQKSTEFADVAVAAFEILEISDEIKNTTKLYKISWPIFTRKNFLGAKVYLYEKLTGKIYWYTHFNDILNEFKPDIIHCHFGYLGVFNMEFKNKFPNKIPYVTSFYGYDISELPLTDEKYRKNLDKMWLSGDGFFAEGPALLKRITMRGCSPSKCFVNPLLIPLEDYPVKTTFRKNTDPIKFLFIGRFVEKKGFHIFLQALSKLNGKINSFKIDIIGAGPMLETYKQIIADNKFEEFVNWRGMVQHADVISILKDYDFLVNPSLVAANGDAEGGAPTIIIESQAVGLPVITTDHDDIPFVMGYHNFLAKQNDINSLAIAIENIVNCENIQHFAEIGKNKVHELHDLNNNKSYELNLKKIAGKN